MSKRLGLGEPQSLKFPPHSLYFMVRDLWLMATKKEVVCECSAERVLSVQGRESHETQIRARVYKLIQHLYLLYLPSSDCKRRVLLSFTLQHFSQARNFFILLKCLFERRYVQAGMDSF